MTSGAGFGQVRMIASNTTDTLTVSQSFSTPPLAGDNYLITAGCGYLVQLRERHRRGRGAARGRQHRNATLRHAELELFRPLTAPAYEVGWASNPAWCQSRWSGVSTGAGTTSIQTVGAGWTPGQYAGMYVYVPSGPAGGQARAIVANSVDTVTVTPPFTASPGGAAAYQIVESNGYVLITSGKASGRVLPIAWDALDNVHGHLIVCAGADLTSFGVTPAQSVNQFNLQNGTASPSSETSSRSRHRPVCRFFERPSVVKDRRPTINPLNPLNPLNVIGGILLHEPIRHTESPPMSTAIMWTATARLISSKPPRTSVTRSFSATTDSSLAAAWTRLCGAIST